MPVHILDLGRRSEAVDAIGRRDRPDLYLLSDVDCPFVQDGWRDGEHVRQWMHERFVSQLNELGARYQLLCGDWAARRAGAIRAVEALLRSPVELNCWPVRTDRP